MFRVLHVDGEGQFTQDCLSQSSEAIELFTTFDSKYFNCLSTILFYLILHNFNLYMYCIHSTTLQTKCSKTFENIHFLQFGIS